MRRIRGEVWALLGIVTFLAVMMTFAHHDDLADPFGEQLHSTYRAMPDGYKALYLTLRELGYPVMRQRRPFAKLPERGLLIMADTNREPITRYEKQKLVEWIAAGNHALILIEAHGEGLLSGDPRVDALDEPVSQEEFTHGPRARSAPAAPASPPVPATMPIPAGAAQDGEARPTVPSFLSARAPSLAVKSTVRFTESAPLPVRLPGVSAGSPMLYRDGSGPVVACSTVGHGSIIWCASPWSFSNDGLKARDGVNLDFVLALADRQPGAPILFDEYHHGFGAGMSLWDIAPAMTKLGIVQLVVAFLLLLATLAWRFGPVRAPVEERFTRSRAEYLTSMAGLLEREKATHVVAKRLQARVRRVLGTRLGLPAHAPLDMLRQLNDAHPLVNAMWLEQSLRGLSAISDMPRPDEDATLNVARAVERVLSMKT